MPNITLSLPSELHKFVKKHNEINWSEIARRAISAQAKKIKLMERLVKDSEFTEKDVANLDGKIKEDLLNRFKK
ncbi:MAG TPA: hypothetical protein VKP59_07040 [Candidatus Thermoplasmatota archaeon]|nr:hypothetical protein [Candidatus Thermoplasmatota archaeon]